MAAGWRAVYVRREGPSPRIEGAQVDEDRYAVIGDLGQLLDLLLPLPRHRVPAESELA
jgi:hypothetical protein